MNNVQYVLKICCVNIPKMECTQRLECSQELFGAPLPCDRASPEQIGFLGICGTKYPVKRGPNKIGRDPSTCSIVLNLNSISRQHAVINVLNGKDIMLMDLDSANKTKLMGKSLPAYIPQPLRNGDTVQFGDVLGIFRLLEEEDELPITQALDIPDTPIPTKHASRLNAAATVVPESPDVSDKDDSFIMATQPKGDQKFKNPSTKFIKQSSKTISIQPVGSNKIDNVFWNSSKKSTSINLDDSRISLNDSAISVRSDNVPVNQSEDIYEMETQPPPVFAGHNQDVDSIYTAATHVPLGYSKDTIHSQDTQYPLPLPQVCKIQNQHDMHIDLSTANKENENKRNAETHFRNHEEVDPTKIDPSLYEAETQIPSLDRQNEEKYISIFEANTQFPTNTKMVSSEGKSDTSKESLSDKNASKNKSVSSDDDIILFDEIDSQSFEERFSSQRLLTDDLPINDVEDEKLKQNKGSSITTTKESSDAAKRDVRLKSDSSTDCEDIEIEQSQKEPFQPAEKAKDDDITDCEEDLFDEIPGTITKTKRAIQESPEIDFEDMPTQILEEDLVNTPNKSVTNNDCNFEDMPTQVLSESNPGDQMNFEDLPTQVLPVNKIKLEQFSEEVISPFKVPLQTPLKFKRKDLGKTIDSTKGEEKKQLSIDKCGDKYYEATQDIYNDLCTQEQFSPEVVLTPRKSLGIVNKHKQSLLNSNKGFNKEHVQDNSFESSDNDAQVQSYVANLSTSQINEVIGVEPNVSAPKKMPSDPSDGEVTPKKVRPFKLMTVDLPNSQEIKTSVSLNANSLITDSSSESEVEEDSQDGTPILFRKSKKPRKNAKMDLSKKFDTSALPTRVITRMRKPSSKLRDSDEQCKKLNKRLLKQTLLTDQEFEIDTEIIQENITRLKTKSEKRSLDKSSTVDTKHVSFLDTKKIERVKEEIEKEVIEIKHEEDTFKNIKERKPKEVKLKPKKESKKETKENTSQQKDKKSKNKTDGITKEKEENISKNKNRTKSKEKSDEIKLEEFREHVKETIKSTEKSKDLASVSQLNESGYIRPRRTRNTKTDKDKKNSTANESSLSKTMESILTTSNSSLKNISTRSDSGTKRSFRYRGKSDNKTEKSPEQELPKKRRGRPKRSEQTRERDEASHEPEVRRSRRQRVVKEGDDKVNKRENKIVHEQSTVYNLSSESGMDSPRGKRRACEELGARNTKRARAAPSTASAASTAAADSTAAAATESSRATPLPAKTQHVLFTAFPSEEVKAKLENLGAVVVSEVRRCSVVVTLQVRRTLKLLCAVGLGRPICGPAYVLACVDAGTLLDPWDYLLEDVATERRLGFSLRATLRGERHFLRGCSLSATPAVLPPPHEMQQIVECCGGTWCNDPGRLGRSECRVVVSCPKDQHLWPALARRGVHIVSSEFILTGVLRQERDLEAFKL